MNLHLDYETYSEIDLRKVGLAKYARHHSTRVLLATIRLPDGSYLTYDERDPASTPMATIVAKLESADTIHAWNAPFEYAIGKHVLKLDIPQDRYRCTMAHALYRAFSGSLNTTAQVLGIEGKTPLANRFIKVFCTPAGGEKPGEWEQFRQYNIHDVEMEHHVSQVLASHPWPESERAVWLMSEEINERGTPVDLDRAKMGRGIFQRLQAEAEQEIQSLTAVKNPNSADQLKKWIRTRGVRTSSIDKDAVARLLKTELPADVKRVLLLRTGCAMTAPKKFEVALRQAVDGVMRSMLQYSGAARTHRWSGRGFQPHNMRRGFDNDEAIAAAWQVIAVCFEHQSTDLLRACYAAPFKTVADLIRSFVHVPGEMIGVADYSSIEVVLLWWAAGAVTQMHEFDKGKDPYKMFASKQFGVAYEKVTKAQRQLAKPPVLGGGYGLGAKTLREYAAGMGVEMSAEQCESAIRHYRDAEPEVVSLWHGLQGAMTATIETGRPHRYHHIRFSMRDQACIMHLPAGTEITYWNARIVPGRFEGTTAIAYEGINQYTGQWDDLLTWGGKLVENAVQSMARDVLVYGLQRAKAAGLDVILHVHDEIAILIRSLYDMVALQNAMTTPPWCADAPIKVASHTCPAYRKD